MVRTRPSSRITTPFPTRSVPRICAVNASSGISARSCTTASSAPSRSKRQSSGRGRISTGNCQSLFSAMKKSGPRGPILLEPRSGCRVEEVHVLHARGQEGALARPDARAAVRHDGDLLVADLHEELGLGAHRLDHHHLGGDAGAGKVQVLGADAVLHPLALGGTGARDGPAPPESFNKVIAIQTLEDVHGGGADELRDEQVYRPVVELERL